jgi:nucleoside diphosphate kinase
MTDTRIAGRYRSDVYFLDTNDALDRLRIDAGEFATRTAVLLLKPDAAVTGGMGRAVSWLIGNDYRIVGAHPLRLTPLHLRALWYFNWHRATPERRKLADRLAQMTPSVVLIVTHPDETVPVSVRLTADKGPADPALRVPGQLRHALASGTYLLNQVHSPDDPDDVLRELSIYFAEPVLSEVISACAQGTDVAADAIRLTRRIEGAVPRRSGDLMAAHDAAWAHLRAAGVASRPETGPDWMTAIEVADNAHNPLDPWYRLVLESAHLPMHRQQDRDET